MIRTLTAAFAAIALAMPALAEPPTRFTVTTTGKGPDVILIPGLASSGAVWDDTVKQLAPTHRVHVLQVNGFAGSPAGPNAQGEILAPLVEEVSAYAATLKKPAIIGHSLGGLIALEAAAKYPDAVDRIMVVDAAPFYGLLVGGMKATSANARLMAAPMKDQIATMDEATFAQNEEQSIAALVKSPDKRAAPLKWALDSDRAVVAQAMYDDIVEDARPLLPQITAKATILYAWDTIGLQQGLTAERADGMFVQMYAGLKDVKLKRIDDTYHFIMLDQPAAFAKEVAAFLK